MNIKLSLLLLASLFALGTPSNTRQPVYYQSDWTTIIPNQIVEFPHSFSKLPSFINIYVGDFVNNSEFTPVSAVPYQDMPDQCLDIHHVTPQTIIVSSLCDSDQTIQVNAVLYSP